MGWQDIGIESYQEVSDDYENWLDENSFEIEEEIIEDELEEGKKEEK